MKPLCRLLGDTPALDCSTFGYVQKNTQKKRTLDKRLKRFLGVRPYNTSVGVMKKKLLRYSKKRAKALLNKEMLDEFKAIFAD